jgi:GNAT superfamily N-acetyltransferase
MNIRLRRADKADCSRILELVRELAAYERAPDEVTVSPEHFENSGFGGRPVWWAFVAEVDGHVEGFALYYIRYSTWKGQQMYLEDIIVTEKFRGRGIGKLLFDRLLVECREKGWKQICWQVLDWNAPAINFYEKYQNVSRSSEWLNFRLEMQQL